MPWNPTWVLRACLILGWAVSVAAAVAPARAQTTEGPAAATGERDQLFREVALEVAAIERQGNVLKKVVKLVKPAVVHVEAKKVEEQSTRYGTRKPREEAGSGVVVDINGRKYVLTNRHVISNAPLTKIQLSLADGRRLRPSQKWEDPGTDVAVLAIKAEDLTVARLGDSSQVEIGDFVLAVGSPFGLSHSVTYGIISAKGRRDLKLGHEGVKFQNFFQTDAAINPGNSGGPLLNLRGEVIAINTAIASSSGGSEGIGFAIPINMFMVVARQLVENGKVLRSFLGVHLDSSFNSDKAAGLGLPRPGGTRVTGITPNSPAQAARLQVDDVILEVNGVLIEDDSHLVNLVSLLPLGEPVTLRVWRERRELTVEVNTTNRAKFELRR